MVDVLGKANTGVYGGLAVVSAAISLGLVGHACQTVAWSYAHWHKNAGLRQFADARWGNPMAENARGRRK